ncbi:preprotein translocase subunit SecG [Patescibacteria group bacterium]
MNPILSFTLIAINIILVILILIQQKGTALGSSFGQSSEGGSYGTMRGAEKKIFWLTCILGAAFIILVLLSHLLNA